MCQCVLCWKERGLTSTVNILGERLIPARSVVNHLNLEFYRHRKSTTKLSLVVTVVSSICHACLVQLARMWKARGRENEGNNGGRSLSATIAEGFDCIF